MVKRSGFILRLSAAVLFLAAVAHAGVYYEAKTTNEGKGAETQDAYVKAWVSGEKIKIIFESSGNPVIEKGNYLLSTDGGKVVYLVIPEIVRPLGHGRHDGLGAGNGQNNEP
ncbi:MAG: hypothetical protein ACUVRQ_06190 [Thermoanaerobaculaceae bacterium]